MKILQTVDLERLGVSDLPAVRVALAVSLFRSSAVSTGFAARMAGKPLAEMLTLLSSQGLPLRYLKSWRG